MFSDIFIVYCTFAFILVSSFEMYGLGSCPSTNEVPRELIDTPALELFYSFKLDTPSNEGISVVENNVSIPLNQNLRGWYYREDIAQGRHDSGIVEQIWSDLYASFFPDTNVGASENYMAIEQEGHWTEEEMEQTIQEAEQVIQEVENYNFEEDNDKLRIELIAIWASGTSMLQQFAQSPVDLSQIEAVSSNPTDQPDFAPYRTRMTSAVNEFQSVDDYPYKKTATSCSHFKSPEINVAGGYFVMPLGQQMLSYKGILDYISPANTDPFASDIVVAKSFWNYNEQENALEILWQGFAKAHVPSYDDGSTIQHHFSPPHMPLDGRVTFFDHYGHQPADQTQYCPYINQAKQIPVDKIGQWLPLDVVCPESLLQKFREEYDSFYKSYRERQLENFALQRTSSSSYEEQVQALEFYMEFLPCGNKYMQMGVPYGHGFGVHHLNAWIHVLLEFNNDLIDFLVHPELQSFDVGYKYGEGSAEEEEECTGDKCPDCGSWCADHASSWEEKCPWLGCSLCTECTEVTEPEPEPLGTGEPEPEPLVCNSWCANNDADWDTKCGWSGCAGCTECLDCSCQTLDSSFGIGDYGSYCEAWDLHPDAPYYDSCTDDEAELCGAENWCQLAWCYVPEGCPGATESSMYPENYWSYEFCGTPNCYSDPNAEGCPHGCDDEEEVYLVEFVEQEVEYMGPSGETLNGYTIYQDLPNDPMRPGLLLFPGFWGDGGGSAERDIAKEFANMGMVVFVADYFTETYSDENMDDLAESFDRYPGFLAETENAQGVAMAAYNTLKDMDITDEEKMAALGFCFGGSMALNAARAGAQLRVAASMHGEYPFMDDEYSRVTGDAWNVDYFMEVIGGLDPFIGEDARNSWKNELDAHMAQEGSLSDYELVVLGKALHGFSIHYSDEFYEFLSGRVGAPLIEEDGDIIGVEGYMRFEEQIAEDCREKFLELLDRVDFADLSEDLNLMWSNMGAMYCDGIDFSEGISGSKTACATVCQRTEDCAGFVWHEEKFGNMGCVMCPTDNWVPVFWGSDDYSGCRIDRSLNTPEPISCASHDDCAALETPFCYDGLCDTCDQCEYCQDGIDDTCGPCASLGFPSQESGPCECELTLVGTRLKCSSDTRFGLASLSSVTPQQCALQTPEILSGEYQFMSVRDGKCVAAVECPSPASTDLDWELYRVDCSI